MQVVLVWVFSEQAQGSLLRREFGPTCAEQRVCCLSPKAQGRLPASCDMLHRQVEESKPWCCVVCHQK